MMHLEAITPSLKIPSDALVLEVGSGHRPHPRADVLSDKYLEDIERGGKLFIDRPFVQADVERLPFKSKAFDYVICRHVLEHTENPQAALNELSRVARAGYIETPSAVWEWLHPTRAYHRWYVLEINGELVMMRKKPDEAPIPFGHLFEVLNKYSPEYRLFIRKYADLFYVRYQWDGEIAYCINPSDKERRSWFMDPWDKAKAAHFITPRSLRQQAFDLLAGVLGSIIGGLWRRVSRPRPYHRGSAIDLAALMQCPVCSQQRIQIGEGQALCQVCGWHTFVMVPK